MMFRVINFRYLLHKPHGKYGLVYIESWDGLKQGKLVLHENEIVLQKVCSTEKKKSIRYSKEPGYEAN